jgi:hypothetical protein
MILTDLEPGYQSFQVAHHVPERLRVSSGKQAQSRVFEVHV